MGQKGKASKYVWLFLLAGLLFLCSADSLQAAQQKVKIGNTVSVAKKGAVYTTSDSSIAYVNEKGRVTAKKPGTAVITVNVNGKKTKQTIQVVENGAMKAIQVCADEIEVMDNETVFVPVYDKENVITSYRYQTTLEVKNNSSGEAEKLVVKAKLGKKSLSFTCESLSKGKTKVFSSAGTISADTEKLKIQSLSVVSNKMKSTYDAEKKKILFDYATPDKKAPVISGLIGSNSYNDGIPYRIVYSDDKNYDYLKYVSAVDDRDGKVKVKVDTSKVNFKKTGTYTITYTAEDKAGNVGKATAKIGVRVPNQLDAMCTSVLNQITKPGWSDTKKASAIYSYTRGHISYTGTSDKSNWENEAKRGLINGSGDCFTYYAVARALLTRAGIMNIEVTRVQGHGHHWWNMVYVQGGFYHFDTCPRRMGGRFCMVTDSQLSQYSRTHGNSHIWAYDKKPKTPKKTISNIF